MKTKLEFLSEKCDELQCFADKLADIDEDTGETFNCIAYVIKSHIQCLDRKPSGQSEYRYAVNCVASTIPKLQAIHQMYAHGVLRIKKGLGWSPEYVACVKCLESFFEVDTFPFTENDPECPTTMQGVMGSMSPGAYV